MIVLNSKTNEFEYHVNGKMVRRSKSRAKLEQTVREMGHDLSAVTSQSGQVEVKKSEFTVNERFEFIAQFTKLAAKGVIPGLVITGDGGLGKTRTVLDTLEKMGLKEDAFGIDYDEEDDGEENEGSDADYVFIKGYSTARNVYTSLYRNNGKIIIFDDCDSSFRDPIGSMIFKAALDSYDKRIISWGAESKDDTVPSRFLFTGKVIFISNLTMSKFPQAILSRSMLVDLTLTMEEKIERIQYIFQQETDYDQDDKIEVMHFLVKHQAKAKDLNVRSAFNILKIKKAIGKGWEKPALYNFTTN